MGSMLRTLFWTLGLSVLTFGRVCSHYRIVIWMKRRSRLSTCLLYADAAFRWRSIHQAFFRTKKMFFFLEQAFSSWEICKCDRFIQVSDFGTRVWFLLQSILLKQCTSVNKLWINGLVFLNFQSFTPLSRLLNFKVQIIVPMFYKFTP